MTKWIIGLVAMLVCLIACDDGLPRDGRYVTFEGQRSYTATIIEEQAAALSNMAKYCRGGLTEEAEALQQRAGAALERIAQRYPPAAGVRIYEGIGRYALNSEWSYSIIPSGKERTPEDYDIIQRAATQAASEDEDYQAIMVERNEFDSAMRVWSHRLQNDWYMAACKRDAQQVRDIYIAAAKAYSDSLPTTAP